MNDSGCSHLMVFFGNFEIIRISFIVYWENASALLDVVILYVSQVLIALYSEITTGK